MAIDELIARPPNYAQFLQQGIGGLADPFIQAQRESQRKQALADIPRNPDGSLDYRQATARLLAIGDMEGAKTLGALASTDFDRLYKMGTLDVARRQAERKEAPTIGEIYDPATGRPQKVAVTGAGVVPIGGTKTDTNDPLSREEAKKAAARVDLYKSQADTAQGVAADIAQMRELRKGVGYEGGFLAGPRSKFLSATGLGSGGAGHAIQSKALELQLSFTEKTKGAITDREMATFAGATPGIDMPDDAAEKVLNGMEAAARRAIERGKFFEQWLRTHRSLAGAQESWDRFITEKPILGAGMKINEANIANWRPYIGQPDTPQRPSQGQPQQPVYTPQRAAPPQQPQPAVQGAPQPGALPQGVTPQQAIAEARAAIERGASRDAVIQRLQQYGINVGL